MEQQHAHGTEFPYNRKKFPFNFLQQPTVDAGERGDRSNLNNHPRKPQRREEVGLRSSRLLDAYLFRNT